MPSISSVNIAHVSNAPIPRYVHQLPPNLEPQPALVAHWCAHCPVQLTTKTSLRHPKGTLESFVFVMLPDEGFCVVKGKSTVCSPCSEQHSGGCVPVLPEFRRAVNVLEYWVRVARRHTLREFHGTLPAVDDALIATILSSNTLRRDWDFAWQYVQALVPAFRAFKTEEARLIKERHGNDVTSFRSAREKSAEMNLRRYELGIGSTGLNYPKNVVVDAKKEAIFRDPNGLRNQERRFYYYGTHIAEVEEGQPDDNSPVKRRKTPARSESPYRMED